MFLVTHRLGFLFYFYAQVYSSPFSECLAPPCGHNASKHRKKKKKEIVNSNSIDKQVQTPELSPDYLI